MLNRKAIDGRDIRGVEDIKEGLVLQPSGGGGERGVTVPAVGGRIEVEVGREVEEEEVVGG